jgi:hypothetical protein
MRYKITEKVGDVEVSYEAFTVKGAHELAEYPSKKDLSEYTVLELLEAVRDKSRSEGGQLVLMDAEQRVGYPQGISNCKVIMTLLTDSFSVEDFERFYR